MPDCSLYSYHFCFFVFIFFPQRCFSASDYSQLCFPASDYSQRCISAIDGFLSASYCPFAETAKIAFQGATLSQKMPRQQSSSVRKSYPDRVPAGSVLRFCNSLSLYFSEFLICGSFVIKLVYLSRYGRGENISVFGRRAQASSG